MDSGSSSKGVNGQSGQSSSTGFPMPTRPLRTRVQNEEAPALARLRSAAGTCWTRAVGSAPRKVVAINAGDAVVRGSAAGGGGGAVFVAGATVGCAVAG